MSQRDEFSESVKQKLMKRAGYACSFDNCKKMPFGPSSESSNASTNTGKAAHICAAAPGRGARRYDWHMTKQQRSSIENAIWLCSEHASLIDQDEITFTVETLQNMKRRHEEFIKKFGPVGLYITTRNSNITDIRPSVKWLEYLQDEARADRGALSLDYYVEFEKKAYQISESKFDMAANASLLLAFEISKVSPEKINYLRPLLSHTRRLAQKRCREAMAAKWVLARIDLSLASRESSSFRKRQLTSGAYQMLSHIEATKFYFPVLLPGAHQEIESSLLDDSGDSNLAPFVRVITKPHRYCTAAALSLAGLSDFQDPEYLRIAEHHAEHNLRRRDAVSAASLNARTSIVVIQAIRHFNGSAKISTMLSYLRSIDKIIQDIGEAQSNCLISKIKAKEFCSVMYVCALIVTPEEFFFKSMMNEIKSLVLLAKRIPDFLIIDHIYRLAYCQYTGNAFEKYVAILSKYLNSSK